MESVYEYGQRIVLCRLIDLFKGGVIKVTFFAVAKILEPILLKQRELSRKGMKFVIMDTD